MKVFIAITFALLASICRGDGGHIGKPDHHDEPLFQALGFTHLNEVQLSTFEAIQVSDIIVRGKIVSITEGRTIQNLNGYSSPINTALIKLEVSSTLKGKPGKFVYFEYIVGGMPASYLDERKYEEDMLVLLRTTTWPESDYRITDSPSGLMGEVDTLYQLTTQRGLMIEKHSDEGISIDQPLDDGDPLFLGQSFDSLGKEIPALLGSDSYGFDLKNSSPAEIDDKE